MTLQMLRWGGFSRLARRSLASTRLNSVRLSSYTAQTAPRLSNLPSSALPLQQQTGFPLHKPVQQPYVLRDALPAAAPAPQPTVQRGGISPSDFRRAFRHAASSVWVVTSSQGEKPVGFTAISIVSVSVAPPMLSFNISKVSSSLPALTESGRFAVHLLDGDSSSTDLALRFAAKPSSARFADRDSWSWDERWLPDVKGALSRITGSVVQMVEAGDSWLVLGLVDSVSHRAGPPLLHHSGVYRALPAHLPPGTSTTSTTTSSASSDAAAGSRNSVAAPPSPTSPVSTSAAAPLLPSPSKRRIYLNAFDMACSGGHQCPGVWTHPEDQSHRYKDLSYWTELAQLLDRSGFDTLFLADVLGSYDVYRGSRDAAVQAGAQLPVNEPTLAIPAMAAVTRRLCFAATVCLTYEQPYSFARRMSTLDHLTEGRIAWNIVTSYLESAAVNLGLSTQIPHDERYDIAEEYMDVCYKLWEASWEDDAVVRDKASRVFALPHKVHDIGHAGKYYTVPGVHLCEPSPQRTPMLFQAGASSKGKLFAARHAEGIFVISLLTSHCRKLTSDIRRQAAALGRDPASVKIYALMTVVVAETDAAAREKLAVYQSHASMEGALAMYGGWTGIDLSKVDPDAPLEYVENNSLRSVGEMLKAADSSVQWTARKVAAWIGIGAVGPVVVGSPSTVADELERWMDEGDLDGFNLPYVITPASFEEFGRLVIPELRRRGRLPQAEADGANSGVKLSMRERLGGTSARLPDHHPGAAYRRFMQQRKRAREEGQTLQQPEPAQVSVKQTL